MIEYNFFSSTPGRCRVCDLKRASHNKYARPKDKGAKVKEISWCNPVKLQSQDANVFLNVSTQPRIVLFHRNYITSALALLKSNIIMEALR